MKVIDGTQLPKISEHVEHVGLDVEVSSDDTGLLHPEHTRLRTIQIAVPGDETYVITDKFEALTKMGQLDGVRCLGHNISFDITQLRHHIGLKIDKVYDTMVAEGMINAARPLKIDNLSLKRVTQHYLGKTRDKDIRMDFAKGAALSDSMLEYAAEDAEDLLPIYERQQEELATWQPSESVLRLEMKLVPVVADIQYRGIRINARQWLANDRARRKRLKKLVADTAYMLTGGYRVGMFGGQDPMVNIGSHVILKKLLIQNGISVENTQVGTLLEAQVRHGGGSKKREILANLVQISELRKSVTTYGRDYVRWISPNTGRAHTSLFQTHARTGRFASAEPNLTNVPVDVEFRGCYIPDVGNVLIKADYSQQEVRIMCFVSGDPTLLAAFEKGDDPYLTVAWLLFDNPTLEKSSPERTSAKSIVLGLFYGMGVMKLAATLGYSLSQTRNLLSTFKARFRKVYEYTEEVVARAERLGYAETLIGRRRSGDVTLPGFTGQMRNHGIQGCGADMLKLASIILHGRLADIPGAYIVNLVHDEILVECKKKDAAKVAKIQKESMMEAAGVLVDVPFEVDVSVGRSWGDDSYNRRLGL